MWSASTWDVWAGQGGEDHLMEERVSVERGGTDGDIEKAAQLYWELDGKVDAFGVGGADRG